MVPTAGVVRDTTFSLYNSKAVVTRSGYPILSNCADKESWYRYRNIACKIAHNIF